MASGECSAVRSGGTLSKKYVERLPHSCGSSKGLQVFEEPDGSYTGFCFSCHTYVKDPYSDKEEGYTPPKPKQKSEAEVRRELDFINNRLKADDLPDLKLKKSTLEYFGVRLGWDQETASKVHAHYYPYKYKGEVAAYQVRIVENKRFFSIGNFDICEPFGWEQALKAGGRKLFITEGQKDAMTVFQVLQTDNYPTPAVISLPNGTKSVQKMSRYVKYLSNWKEVVIVFDEDAPGKKAVQDFIKMYPEAKIAKLPLKDPHEMLMAGREKELYTACQFNAKRQLSDKLIRSSDLWERAGVRPEQGISWPWPSLTNITRGIRTGEGYYFGAGVKMGKSCIVNEIAGDLIVNHNETVFLCKPEEENHITAQKLAGIATDTVFHDPRIEFDHAAFEEGKKLINDKAILYGEYGKVEWDDLKREIRYVCVGEGVKRIIIDPITCLTVGVSSGEANERLVEIASELASMAKEMPFTYFVFCHLNAPNSGKPHERGGEVLSVQFAGSRAMMRKQNAHIKDVEFRGSLRAAA